MLYCYLSKVKNIINIRVNIHLISDLNLRFNEPCPDEEILPDVDLIIVNGNIANNMKRTMLYLETVCKKYPTTQFVFNPGQNESNFWREKNSGEGYLNLSVRKNSSQFWPKNLHYSKEPMLVNLRDGSTIDLLCIYGFPRIHKIDGNWEETDWFKFYVQEFSEDVDGSLVNRIYHKSMETSRVRHGLMAVYPGQEWVNKKHEEEWRLVKNWEIKSTTHFKILVTHINPYKDKRFNNLVVSPYQIHLLGGLWIGSNIEVNGINFLGSMLYSNPGRGKETREKIIGVDLSK